MKTIEKPKVINLPITEVCDSKCIMCNVWSVGKIERFTSENINEIFGQSFFNNVAHIGISGGEPTLNDDLVSICESLINLLPNLKTISLTSHGYHTDKHQIVLPLIKQVCDAKNVSFSLNISIDGIEEMHIKIRRIKDAFFKAIKTANYAKKIGIFVQLQCTISNVNVYNIVKVREFALNNGFDVIFRVASYIARLSNGNLSDVIELTDKERSFVADFLVSSKTMMATKSLSRRLFYQDLAYRLINYSERKAPCAFKNSGLFISPDHSCYNCSRSEVKLEINDLRKIEPSIYSETNKQILDDLINNTCNECYHDQNGRWPIWKYLTVHDLIYKHYQKILKLKKVPSILLNALLPIREKPTLVSNKVGKVLIIGCYGGEHVGDAAILGGVILRLISKYQFNCFEIISIRKDRTECWISNLNIPDTKITVISHNLPINPLKYDCLVLAGGPIMGIPTLLSQHLSIIKLFKANSLPFLIEGIGFGPLSTKLTRIIANKIIKIADNVTVRTKEDLIRTMTLRNDIEKTQDPAFDYLQSINIQNCNNTSLNKILKTNKKIWVINIRPLWKAYSSDGSDISIIEKELLDVLCTTLLKYKVGRKFIFMPMNADQFGFSDLEVAYKLESKIKEIGKNIDFEIWETEPKIDECIYLLKNSELTISMRFHGCIFSLAQNIPTIGIDYSTSEKGKVYSLFEDRGLQSQVINIKNFKSERLIKILDNTINKINSSILN